MGSSGREVPAHSEEEKAVRRPMQGVGIRCTQCGGQTHVTNSIPFPAESKQCRYRKCDVCGAGVYTEETITRDVVQRNKIQDE